MAPVSVSPAPVVFTTQLLFTAAISLTSPLEWTTLILSSPFVMIALAAVRRRFLQRLPTFCASQEYWLAAST